MHEFLAHRTGGGGKAHRAHAPAAGDAEAFQRALFDHLLYTCVKDRREASPADFYRAMAHSVRDRLVQRWLATQRTYVERDVKRAYYLSSEFLTGRSLGLCLLNLGLYGVAETRRGSSRLRSRRGARARGRSGAGQRRTGAPGRVLHGLAGDARAAGRRLRHPLRVRHLRAAHRRRPAGRAPRQLAAVRQPVGAAAPRARRRPCALRRARAMRNGRPTGRMVVDWVDATHRARRCPTTRSSSGTRPTP